MSKHFIYEFIDVNFTDEQYDMLLKSAKQNGYANVGIYCSVTIVKDLISKGLYNIEGSINFE
jgi:hypothetical protein